MKSPANILLDNHSDYSTKIVLHFPDDNMMPHESSSE